METKNKNNAAVQGAATKGTEVKTTNRPNLTGKEAKNEEAESQKPAESPKVEQTEAKNEEQHKAEPAKTEPAKSEEVKRETVPSGIGLERTLKTVHTLYRECMKRDNLIGRIDEQEKFEIQLMEESDELEGNHFQGCKLAIYDSKGRTFITNTSNLIKMVAEFVKKACYSKLAEIEAGIKFPNA
jgi:hypothetical protein